MLKALEYRLDDIKKNLLREKDERERARWLKYGWWVLMMYRYQEGDCIEVRNHEYFLEQYEKDFMKGDKDGEK